MSYHSNGGGGAGGGYAGGGDSPTTDAALPFTSVATDFIKKVKLDDGRKLQEINFAATDFLSLKESLVSYMKAVYPLDFQNFNESDLGMVLIELVAYMGAVMSMKVDMLANENFLPTARNRANVDKLLSLIGIKNSGPNSSAANAQVTLDAPLLTETLVISPSNRVVTTTSPQDGMPLSFTLYKLLNGAIVPSDGRAQVILNKRDASNEEYSTFENLVLVEGALVVDEGHVGPTAGIKTIPLSQNPVVESSVEVFFNTGPTSGVFTRVDNLYMASALDQRIFETIVDGNGNTTILFGDGFNGISPAPNTSYTVSYRVGGGSRGNVGTAYLNTIFAGQNTDQLAVGGRLTNTSPATGGTDQQSIEQAKKWGPLTFKRQDRVVTLDDYVAFASNFKGPFGTVAKATASTRKSYCSANIIDVFVLEVAGPMQLQKASLSYKEAFLMALKPKKMLTDEVVINDGFIASLDLVTTITLDETYRSTEQAVKSKVQAIILSYFNVANRDFGQSLSLSDLLKNIYTLDEVRFATVDNLSEDVAVDFNGIIQLNNSIINVSYY